MHAAGAGPEEAGGDSDSDFEMMEPLLPATPGGAKRKRDDGADAVSPAEPAAAAKRACTADADGGAGEVLEVELADGIGAPLAAPDDDDLILLNE